MLAETRERAIRGLLHDLKEIASQPSLEARYAEVSLLTDAVSVLVKTPSLRGFQGPETYFHPDGRMSVL